MSLARLESITAVISLDDAVIGYGHSSAKYRTVVSLRLGLLVVYARAIAIRIAESAEARRDTTERTIVERKC